MSYTVVRLLDPYRGTFEFVDSAIDDFEEAWRRAGEARERAPDRMFVVLSTETREDPKRVATTAKQSLARK